MPRPGGAPSYERMADEIKSRAREQQGDVRERMTKTDQGIEQLQQKKNSIKTAIGNIKKAIGQLQAQAQANPQVRNHPLFQKRMSTYQQQLKKYEAALQQVDSQIEMLRGRKNYFRATLIKVAAGAGAQLSKLRQRFDAQKSQQAAAQEQQKRKAAKAESGKVRG